MVAAWGTGVKDYSQSASRMPIATFKKGEANLFFSYNRYVWGASSYTSIFVWAFNDQHFLVNGVEKILDTDEVILKRIIVSCDANVPVNVRLQKHEGGYGIQYLTEVVEYNDIQTVAIDMPKGWKFNSSDYLEVFINNPDDVTDPYYHYYTVTMFGTARLNIEKLKTVLEEMGLSMDNA